MEEQNGLEAENKMKQVVIRDLKDGDKVDIYAMLTMVKEKEASTKKMYVDLTFEDNTGTIDGKVWDYDLKKLAIHGNFEVGAIVKIRGVVESYQNKKQIKIDKVKDDVNKIYMRCVNETDSIVLDDYVKKAPLDSQFMFDELLAIARSFKNKTLKHITVNSLTANKALLLFFPGAQLVHHAYYGGLLHHIYTMVMMAEAMEGFYPSVDFELLIAGCIIHDMGKLDELIANETGKASDYTTSGILLGHMITGIKRINAIAMLPMENESDTLPIENENEIEMDVVMLLEHMIASHHFEETWGAYQKPAFIEAELLHHLDLIDSKVNQVSDITEKLEVGTFSDRNKYLNQRKIYRHA